MNQIFKETVKKDILYDFLNIVCEKTDKYFIFDNNAYKRANINDELQTFLNNVKEYYHKSKNFYIERKMTYSRFCTVLRQICNNNNIMFTTKVVYNKSKYNIPYYIYF